MMPLLRSRISARLKRCLFLRSYTLNICSQIFVRVSRDRRTEGRFYRSLRAVKVLLAALRSTLTVLAPREEVRIGSR